jgi:hypothetical protein
VSPQVIDADYDGQGPVVEVGDSDGSTSGRFDVANVIARVFPAYKAFVTDFVKSEYLRLSMFTFAPFRYDKLTYKSKRMVEFRTPAQTDGLGTHRGLKKNASAIDGVAILVGPRPDLLLVSVRLPTGLTKLTSAIVKEVERDASQ